MKQILVRFEPDPSLEKIEVVIRASEQDPDVTALMDQLTRPEPDTITVFDRNGIVRSLQTEEIISASMDGKRVKIVTEEGAWYTRCTLQSLEKTLDRKRFLRISRYELVNLDKVLHYDFTVAGTLRLELMGGIETWASRRCIPQIRKRLTGKG